MKIVEIIDKGAEKIVTFMLSRHQRNTKKVGDVIVLSGRSYTIVEICSMKTIVYVKVK